MSIMELDAIKSEGEKLLNRLNQIPLEKLYAESQKIIDKYNQFLERHSSDLDRSLLTKALLRLIGYERQLFDHYVSYYEMSNDMVSYNRAIYYRLAKDLGSVVLRNLHLLIKKDTQFMALSENKIASLQSAYDTFNQKMQNFLEQHKRYRPKRSINPMISPRLEPSSQNPMISPKLEPSSQNPMVSPKLEPSSQNPMVSPKLEPSSQNPMVSPKLESSSQPSVKSMHPLKKRFRDQYRASGLFSSSSNYEETDRGPISTANIDEHDAKKLKPEEGSIASGVGSLMHGGGR